MEKGIKKMKHKKATGDDVVPENILKLLEEDGLKLLTGLINYIYENGEWPRNFFWNSYCHKQEAASYKMH